VRWTVSNGLTLASTFRNRSNHIHSPGRSSSRLSASSGTNTNTNTNINTVANANTNTDTNQASESMSRRSTSIDGGVQVSMYHRQCLRAARKGQAQVCSMYT